MYLVNSEKILCLHNGTSVPSEGTCVMKMINIVHHCKTMVPIMQNNNKDTFFRSRFLCWICLNLVSIIKAVKYSRFAFQSDEKALHWGFRSANFLSVFLYQRMFMDYRLRLDSLKKYHRTQSNLHAYISPRLYDKIFFFVLFQGQHYKAILPF